MVRIMPPSHIQIWGLSSAQFDFENPIRKSKTMVQWQVAMCAIAKSRPQIKPNVIKDSSMKSILIFSVAGALVCSMPFLQVRQGTIASFLNPRLNGKPRVVHLNCTLMACGDSLSADKKNSVNQRFLPI